MADDVERTEDPTPRRRQQARRKGQIAVSREVMVVANLLGVTLTLMALREGPIRVALARVPIVWHPRAELDPAAAVELLRVAFSGGIAILIPILLATLAAALIGGLIQTRGNVATERLKPKFDKLSPLKNGSLKIRRRSAVSHSGSRLRPTR